MKNLTVPAILSTHWIVIQDAPAELRACDLTKVFANCVTVHAFDMNDEQLDEPKYILSINREDAVDLVNAD